MCTEVRHITYFKKDIQQGYAKESYFELTILSNTFCIQILFQTFRYCAQIPYQEIYFLSGISLDNFNSLNISMTEINLFVSLLGFWIMHKFIENWVLKGNPDWKALMEVFRKIVNTSSLGWRNTLIETFYFYWNTCEMSVKFWLIV